MASVKAYRTILQAYFDGHILPRFWSGGFQVSAEAACIEWPWSRVQTMLTDRLSDYGVPLPVEAMAALETFCPSWRSDSGTWQWMDDGVLTHAPDPDPWRDDISADE
jgi:hypothetical protein